MHDNIGNPLFFIGVEDDVDIVSSSLSISTISTGVLTTGDLDNGEVVSNNNLDNDELLLYGDLENDELLLKGDLFITFLLSDEGVLCDSGVFVDLEVCNDETENGDFRVFGVFGVVGVSKHYYNDNYT